jgi:peroxiredoxin
MKRFAYWLAVLLLTWFISESSAEEHRPAMDIAPALQFDLSALDGKTWKLSQSDVQAVRVLVFLSTTCPIANSYTQELNRISAEFGQRVQFLGVISDPQVTRSEAMSHFREYQASFPVLFDASGLLSEALHPTHVPEVFVLNSTGAIAYRGAIDNAWEAIGRRRPNIEHHYLRDAMEAVLAGRPVDIPSTTPVGCLFPRSRKRTHNPAITWARDIAPLIQTRCQNCHRAGQAAPFALTNLQEVSAHAEMLIDVTQRRIMPPWIPGPGTQPKFVGERCLTSRELEMLREWVEIGCPEGDPDDLPPAMQFADGWQLGAPDLIVKMQDPFTVPAEGPDLLQNFVIPVGITEDKLVAAIEFHPGNKRVVHHAVLFLDDKGQAKKLDTSTPEPGYGNFGGPGFLPSGALGGWSVGNTARRLPSEMGRYLKQGSDLVVQVHYHPTGKQEVDQSEIGLYFVDKPIEESMKQPARLVGSIWMANYEMDIAAGEDHYCRETTYTLPKDVILVGIVPHMHLLGKSMKVTATMPDESIQTLIDVPNWNYNWQDEYYYERPLTLPVGTVLRVAAVFDNSAGNASNPSSPPRRVTWGEETTDEMLFCFFLLTANRTEDLIHTIFDNLGHDLRQPRKDLEPSK